MGVCITPLTPQVSSGEASYNPFTEPGLETVPVLDDFPAARLGLEPTCVGLQSLGPLLYILPAISCLCHLGLQWRLSHPLALRSAHGLTVDC